MKVEIMEVAGIAEALYGMGLSYDKTKAVSWEQFEKHDYDLSNYIYDDMIKRAGKNAPLDKGHNKFLESIQVWLNIEAPRFWWAEMDTYRLTTKQSDSTMHTLLKADFTTLYEKLWSGVSEEIRISYEYDLVDKMCNCFRTYYELMRYIQHTNLPDNFKIQAAKSCLPEAWQQQRVVNCSYKTLKNIYEQRKNHRLSQWQYFCEKLKELPYSEWITGEKNG